MKPVIISILGRPLSGKDTQARILAAGLPDSVIISTGEIIREVKRAGESHRFWPILGPEIAVMDSGVLISEDAINQVFERVVHERLAEGKKYIIATAHPRTLNELASFENMLRRENVRSVMINLDTTEAHMRELWKSRNDGRADDRETVLATRTREYAERTVPMLDALRVRFRLIDIPAEGTIPEVSGRVRGALIPYLPDPEIRLLPMARR